MEELLGKGADVDNIDSEGNTPLILCCKEYRFRQAWSVAKLLVFNEADVNLKDYEVVNLDFWFQQSYKI